MSSYLNRNWFVTSLLLLPVLAMTLFYAPLHLWLGVAVNKLYLPFAIFCLIEPLTTRALYWAQFAFVAAVPGGVSLLCRVLPRSGFLRHSMGIFSAN